MESQDYTEGELWKIVTIEGKGVGAVAKANISKGSGRDMKKIYSGDFSGSLILRDKPLFIIPNQVHTKNPESLNTFLKGLV